MFAEVGLGQDVRVLKKYKGIEIDQKALNIFYRNIAEIYIGNIERNEWLDGHPIESFNSIFYNPKTYKVESFTFNVSMSNFPINKIKNSLVMLYGLPKGNWKLTQGIDPKYGEYSEYLYKCNEYLIEITQSAYGSTATVFRMAEN